jgi:hypothetical protein
MLLILVNNIGVPPCRAARPCGSTGGRFCFRSRHSASGCLSPPAFGEGSGGIPPQAGPFFQSCLARGRRNLFCQVSFIGASRNPQGEKNVFFLDFSTFQLFNVSTLHLFLVPLLFVGAPTWVLDSCNCFYLGCTQEGVAKDTAGQRPRRPERGGNLPPYKK